MTDLDYAILDLEIAMLCHEQELADFGTDLLHTETEAARLAWSERDE